MPKKTRNYSFKNSKRLPQDKMTEVNNVRIPSLPGSCYHAILCSLAYNKNKFCPWDKIIELTEKFMRQYGGNSAWEAFVAKSGVKGYKQRIKDNAHTLTRTGLDCYGYRLHENGMVLYFFKDGAVLFTGGSFKRINDDSYTVVFSDGRELQKRYRGTTMTYNEYKKFLEKKYININGEILDNDAIRDYRMGLRDVDDQEIEQVSTIGDYCQICVTLNENYDQNTANRLQALGLIVEDCIDTELFGKILRDKVQMLQKDIDVIDTVIIGEE